MFNADPTVQVAIIGVLTTLITTSGVIIVAVLNSRKEKATGQTPPISPDKEEILRDRITLRDERIAALREDITERDERIIELEAEREEQMRQNSEKDALIERLTNNQINEENHATHPDRRG